MSAEPVVVRVDATELKTAVLAVHDAATAAERERCETRTTEQVAIVNAQWIEQAEKLADDIDRPGHRGVLLDAARKVRDDAVRAERERCAKIAEANRPHVQFPGRDWPNWSDEAVVSILDEVVRLIREG